MLVGLCHKRRKVHGCRVATLPDSRIAAEELTTELMCPSDDSTRPTCLRQGGGLEKFMPQSCFGCSSSITQRVLQRNLGLVPLSNAEIIKYHAPRRSKQHGAPLWSWSVVVVPFVRFTEQVFKKRLSLVVESLSSVVLWGYTRPSLAGIGVPWVLIGTHRCALMPRVASRQSANPFVARVVLKSCGRAFCQMLELRQTLECGPTP